MSQSLFVLSVLVNEESMIKFSDVSASFWGIFGDQHQKFTKSHETLAHNCYVTIGKLDIE